MTFIVSTKTDARRILSPGDIVTLADALDKQNVKARYAPCSNGKTWRVDATFDRCVDRVECGEVLDTARRIAKLEHVDFNTQRIMHGAPVMSIV